MDPITISAMKACFGPSEIQEDFYHDSKNTIFSPPVWIKRSSPERYGPLRGILTACIMKS